jgi:outer membrane lipoprotein-sorting protein
MNTPSDRELEQQLHAALGAPPEADFDRWRARHGDVVAYLNPIVTASYHKKRRMIMRIASFTVAAAVLLSFVPMFVPQRASFAETVEAIETATTISWTTTFFERRYSKDGQRTWLRTERMEMSYRSPDRYRDTRYDKEGQVSSVEIVDSLSNRALRLDIKSRKATWLAEPTNQYSRGGPFHSVRDILQNEPIELVGQKDLDGVKINIFRYRRKIRQVPASRQTMDIWLDARTKKLVRFYDPGAEGFDLDTQADRDNRAEAEGSKGTLLGSMTGDIVIDAKLDPKLFDLTPPEGFEIVVEPPRPTVTETEMIEWLGATARFNNGTFFDTDLGFDLERYNSQVATKNQADRTEVEQKLFDLQHKHLLNRNSPVMASFANEYTAGGRFRYLGAGVKLGSADRIVLFYRLKSTGTYRAVYGDLTVKDVKPQDLPLPVEE